MRRLFLLLMLFPLLLRAQQPQTSNVANQEHLQALNAKWANGLAIGGMATPPYTGLTFTIGPLTCFTDALAKVAPASGSVSVANNTTSRVYLDGSCAIQTSTSSWATIAQPRRLFEVTAASGAITVVTDVRGIFGPTGSGTVTNTGTLTLNQLVLGNGGVDIKPLGLLGTTTTVYHGNAAGAGSFSAVISADLSITTTSCTNQVVTSISSGAVGSCSTVTNAMLTSSSTSVNGIPCSLGSSCTVFTGPALNATGSFLSSFFNGTGANTLGGLFLKTGVGGFVNTILPVGGWIRNLSATLDATQTAGSTVHFNWVFRNTTSTLLNSYEWLLVPGGGSAGGYVGNNMTPIRVEAGQPFMFGINAIDAVGANFSNLSAELVGDGGAIPLSGAWQNGVLGSATDFAGFFEGTTSAGIGASAGTRAIVMPFAGSATALYYNTSTAQPGTGALTLTLTKNSVAGTVTSALASSAPAGTYRDVAHTDTYAAGDAMELKLVNASPSSSASIVSYGVKYIPTTGTPGFIGALAYNGGSAYANGSTNYSTPYINAVATGSPGTETTAKWTAPRAGTIRNLYAYVKTASAAANTLTVTVRKCPSPSFTCADTAVTGVVSAATSGSITLDITHSVAVAQGDLIDVSLAQSGGSGCVFTSWSAEFD